MASLMADSQTYLIVGLGNPGAKYILTRHNVGHLALEEIYQTLKKDYHFASWQNQKKLKAHIAQGTLNEKKIILAALEVFMNESGGPISNLMHYYKIAPQNLIVIHDEIDLPLGKIKISAGRGGAGHRGVASIFTALKTKKFIRLRIGIHPPSAKKVNAQKIVLERFSKKEKELLGEVLLRITTALQIIIAKGLDKAMARYN